METLFFVLGFLFAFFSMLSLVVYLKITNIYLEKDLDDLKNDSFKTANRINALLEYYCSFNKDRLYHKVKVNSKGEVDAWIFDNLDNKVHLDSDILLIEPMIAICSGLNTLYAMNPEPPEFMINEDEE